MRLGLFSSLYLGLLTIIGVLVPVFVAPPYFERSVSAASSKPRCFTVSYQPSDSTSLPISIRLDPPGSDSASGTARLKYRWGSGTFSTDYAAWRQAGDSVVLYVQDAGSMLLVGADTLHGRTYAGWGLSLIEALFDPHWRVRAVPRSCGSGKAHKAAV